MPDDSVNYSPDRYGIDFFKLLFSFIAILVLCIVLLNVVVSLCVPYISLKTEKKIFSRFKSHGLLAEPMLPNDSKYYQDIKKLFDSLSVHAGFAKEDIELFVSCQNIENTFALPGAKIVVFKNLLKHMSSENELAMVLGHEIGHIKNRDHLKGMAMALSLGIVHTILPSSLVDQVYEMIQTNVLKSFSRKQESQADSVGLNILHKHYGHIVGGKHFFSRMLEKTESTTLKKIMMWNQSHPMNQKRINNIDAWAQRHKVSQNKEKIKTYKDAYWAGLCE